MMYWYNWFSWVWALGFSKHVEKWNKHIKTCVKLVINMNWTSDWILLKQAGSQWQTDVNNAIKYLVPQMSMNMMEGNWVYYVLRCFNSFFWRGSIKYLLELRPLIGTVNISAVIYERICTVDEIMRIVIFRDFEIQVLCDAAAMSTRNSYHMSLIKRNYFRLGFVRRAYTTKYKFRFGEVPFLPTRLFCLLCYFINEFNQSFIHSIVHSLIHSFFLSFLLPLINQFIHTFIHSFFLSFFL